jgi:hypothetical protein
MEFEIWLAFAAASAILVLIPGPTVLLVVSYALGQGWRAALPTAIGVALGDFTAMSLSMLGLGALLQTSAMLYLGLKWLGAAYLEVSRGDTPAPELKKLPLADPASTSQKEMSEVVAELSDSLVPAVKQLEVTLKEIEIAAESLTDPEQNFQITLAGVRELVDEVNKGESAAGILLRDEKAGAEVRVALTKFTEASNSLAAIMADLEKGKGAAGLLLTGEKAEVQLQQTLDNVTQASASANRAAESMNKAAKGLPQTLGEADEAIQSYNDGASALLEAAREYEIVAEALQRHWLLRRFVKREENPVAVPRVQEEADPQAAASASAGSKPRSGTHGLFGGGKEPDKTSPSGRRKPSPGTAFRK